MSGHSKWSSIKHKKGAADAKRGKLFTKLVKEISVAAREGGGDEENNPRLRLAVSNARNANMPNSNIEKAIKKGTGDLEGVNYESYNYEGYGVGGVAIFLEALTDNNNRTVSEIRHIFSSHEGHLAESGSVAWMFEKKGIIMIKKDDLDEDELMMTALDAGAEDFDTEDEYYIIYTEYSQLHNVHENIKDNGYDIEKAELTRIPKNTVDADDHAGNLLRLIEELEDNDDIQKVYANYNISDSIMKEFTEDSDNN